MRKKIYDTVNGDGGLAGTIYNYAMMVIIIVSLVPLIFKEQTAVLTWIDRVCVVIFIADYLLRLFTADFKLEKGKLSFLQYPVTPMAIIDLLCIIPSFIGMASGLKLLKIIRLVRTFRVFRTFKMFRYSKSIRMIINVVSKQRTALATVGILALAYVLISALVIFNIEPETFDNFFDAIYWATIALTTIGFGDIVPLTVGGKIVTIISSVIGIAVVALPAGVITAGYMDELHADIDTKEDGENNEDTNIKGKEENPERTEKKSIESE